VRRPSRPSTFFRRQTFLKNAFDRLGIVHQARTFGEQVFEFIDEFGQFIRRNCPQSLGRRNNGLKFVLREVLQ